MEKFTIKRKVVIEEEVTYRKYISFKIEQLRKDRKLSQEDFAQTLGLSRTSIVNIEKGRQAVSVELLAIICDQFNIKSNTILPF